MLTSEIFSVNHSHQRIFLDANNGQRYRCSDHDQNHRWKISVKHV